ncbi:intermembrane lipid transfer protein VPS13C-like isoform X2 [Liolophura sinensis]|uniref:intermembrane lipid transfer protein VPS13C-like isoform X2 n=1 Tax=Liolophura sinensis TaxID=3198878 RepID=UPI0031581753
MGNVAVGLSQGDFSVIMKLLNENLTEGQPPPGVVSKPGADSPEVKEQPVKKGTASSVSAAQGETKAITAPKIPATTDQSGSKLKFGFKLDSVSASLFSGDTEMTKEVCEHDRAKCLGKFELAGFLVEGEMMNDNSMKVKVILKDTSLEDMRPPKQNGITSTIERSPWSRMIQRSKSGSHSGSASPNMIDVSFIQAKNQDKNVDVKINSIHVCVCTEFLMSIADFFVKGMPPAPKEPPQLPSAKKGVKKAPVKEKPKLAPPPESEMSITVSLGRPDIILIEDPSSYDSNAIILETEMMFKMRVTPDATTMGGSIKDLQLYSCVFNKRDSTKTQILPPCEINLHSNAPYGQGQHMDIQMTDMILSISPATIRTLTAISSGLAPAQETEEGSKSSAVPDNLWAVKTLAETNFWFLNFTVPEAEDAAAVELEASGEQPVEEEEVTHGEQLLLAAPVIVVKLEGGIGKRTVPLLIVETGFQGEVRDWSSELHVESTVNLEVAYYNEALAVWEPVLEPVHENNKRHKWEIAMQVAQNNDVLLIDEDDVDLPIQPPKMSITVKSEDILNTTITKTCLDVLSNLGKAFNDAYNLVEPTVKPGEVMSPYLIQNDTGLDLTIKLDNEFETEDTLETSELVNGTVNGQNGMPPQADSGRVHLPAGKALPVFGRRHNALVRKASIIKATQEGDEKKILFQIDQFGVTREVTINRAEKKLFEINKKTEYPAGDKWAVLVSVEASYGRKTISLRSLVQVHNHMSQAVEVFYKKGEKDLVSVGRADPGKSLPLPLPALYTYTSEIYFKPVSDRYGICTNGVNWRTASESGLFPLTCATKDGHASFYMNVNPTPEKVLFEDSSEMNRECLTLNLHPTVILHNLLPFSLSCLLETKIDGGSQDATEEVHLDRGENYALYNASVNKSSMEFKMKYRGLQWTGRRQIQADVPELSIWTFEATNEKGEKKHLDLGLHNKQGSGTLDISLYSPYWMINKTGMPLAYRGNDAEVTLEHPADYKDIVLFSFKAKSLFSKKKDNKEKNGKGTVSEKKTKVKEMKQAGKASLKIRDSEWSDKFSLDVVGSSGTVQCKTKTGSYECGVRIDMTSSGLSKIVTFTPFYMLVNTTETTVSCKEPVDSALWLDVAPGECLPFWPQQTGKEMKLKAKVKLSDEETGPFLINTAHTTLLKLDNEYGGLDVECHVSESAMVTTIGPYKHGCASVLLVNQAENLSISFSQSGVGKTHSLGGKQAVLYTWEDALGKRELVWSCGEKKDERNDLTKDGCGDVFYLPDCKLFWVSFLDGPQRVLLFTEDMAVVGLVQKEVEYTFERIDQEINLSLRGVGLSLVNNINQTEVAFMGITSSGIIWEEKKKRYKALNLKTLVILEAAYQKYLIELAAGKSPSSRVTLENKMEVDFEEMQMYKPHKRGIRRSFVEGVWVQYKTSPHQLQLHAKINRLQFDNQLAGAVFPTVLSPLPPPKSVAADSVPKPFTEVSLMLSKHEHSHMTQIKYFKVLIQEMALKVDQGFLNAIISLFSADVPISREQETKQFEEDWKQTNLPLVEIVGVSLSHGKKNFYDHLHFSPIKVHLSFSLQGGGEDGDKPTAIQANVLNVFLQSVGVVLTDVQDVVFKLGYFERNHSFYNNSQLSSEMTSHYVGQAIKQMYVLVLGLDVLGNPFGLLRGLTEGVGDLFYEPYQGAIQGPEEFAEGLALGVRSLFGHAVGGAAGAASRITGTLGKGIAVLTFDDDYQKKRRQQLNKRPANAREGFARGGKGLIMGVFDGVTGIVRKPMEGAKQEGVGGFFKGMGKGLVGVVTRPTSGVIDFASTSLDGIKRIVDLSDEIRRLRPPRRFHKDLIIRPYIHTEAEGYAILQETEKGRYVDDDYVAHAVVTKDGKNVLVVTDKRIVFASKGELLGQWNCEFTYTWVDLKEPPRVISKGIEVVLKDKEKKKFLFGGSSSKKEIHITDKKTAEWIVEKIHEQMERGR